VNKNPVLGAGLAALLLATANPAPAQSGSTPGPSSRNPTMHATLLEVLDQSQKSGKGVLVYMGSHAIGGAVVKIGEHTVELRNREYGRIVLRLDRIDGVAGN
jgi:hypothetical protein